MKLQRVVLRLLRKVDDPAVVSTLVKTMSPRIETLSARMALVEMVGHRDHIGHGLVAEPARARRKGGRNERFRMSPICRSAKFLGRLHYEIR